LFVIKEKKTKAQTKNKQMNKQRKKKRKKERKTLGDVYNITLHEKVI
jgi:hypothetical protein